MTRFRNFDVVFILMVFALYTTVGLLLAAIGARVYQTANETLTSNYDQRTSVLYIAQKVRQNDSDGQIEVVPFGDSYALVFGSDFNGAHYENWIYVKDGYLREELLAPGALPDSRYSQAIMPMQSMEVDDSNIDSGLIVVKFTMADGDVAELTLYVKTGLRR